MCVAIISHQLIPPRRGSRPPPLEQASVQQAAMLSSGLALRRGCTWDWYPWKIQRYWASWFQQAARFSSGIASRCGCTWDWHLW